VQLKSSVRYDHNSRPQRALASENPDTKQKFRLGTPASSSAYPDCGDFLKKLSAQPAGMTAFNFI